MGNIGQTQIRMITTPTATTPGGQLAVPKIGQTTIRQTTPIRIQTPATVQGQPRLVTQIRPGGGTTTIVQHPATAGIQSTPPALQPVSGLTHVSPLLGFSSLYFNFCRFFIKFSN